MATLPLVIAMALSVLVQAYLAGAAAAVDADFWALHKTWIAIFQWLSVLLAIATFFGQRDLLTRLLSFVPMIIIAIQYTSIHLALRQVLRGSRASTPPTPRCCSAPSCYWP